MDIIVVTLRPEGFYN